MTTKSLMIYHAEIYRPKLIAAMRLLEGRRVRVVRGPSDSYNLIEEKDTECD